MYVNKANKLLGLVHKTVGSSIPGAFGDSTLYKSFVCLVLEYAAPTWNPCLAKDVLALELEFSEEPLGFLSGKNVVRWNTKIV